MVKTVVIKPLGLVLRQAGLVSSEQVEKALKESLNLPKYRLGEILAIRGLIKPETADFFAEIWPYIIESNGNYQIEEATEPKLDSSSQQHSELFHNSRRYSFPKTKYRLRSLPTLQVNSHHNFLDEKNAEIDRVENKQFITFNELVQARKKSNPNIQPLGQYLKAANLINEQQIGQILDIQKDNSTNFGKIAVERGIISQNTLDFFLKHLNLIKTGEPIKICSETVALELDRIEKYLLYNQKCEPMNLLQTYYKIRQQGAVIAEGNLVEQELLISGIITIEKNAIRIAKTIYKAHFDEEWLEKELARLKPYNQIRLKMFDLDRKAVIPYKILNAVDRWCNHEPFLTQKLYQLIQAESNYVLPGEEESLVEELTYKYIIENWQTSVAAKHFQKIGDRLTNKDYAFSKSLLKVYKKIWQLKEINANNSREQTELLRIGLIKLENNRVSISNPIYQAVFDLQWIEKQLDKLKPTKFSGLETVSKSKLLKVSRNVSSGKNKYILLLIASFLLTVPLLKIIISTQSQPEFVEPRR